MLDGGKAGTYASEPKVGRAYDDRRDHFRVVHNRDHVTLPGQFDKTSGLALAGKFAGDKDVRNTVRDQRLVMGLLVEQMRNRASGRIGLPASRSIAPPP